MHGKGMMIVGDWCQFPTRERCFEVRTMLAGDLTVCKRVSCTRSITRPMRRVGSSCWAGTIDSG